MNGRKKPHQATISGVGSVTTPTNGQNSRKKYRQELDTRDEILNMLIKKARKGNITLLYAAKDTEHNNAIALKEFLEEKLA